MVKIIVAGFITLLISGCGRQLDEGEVIGKRYEPEHTYVMMIPIVISCGNNCVSTVMMPYLVRDDEDYILIVQGYNDDDELITENWYVDKKAYEKATTGRREVFTNVNASRDDDHEKLGKADT